MMDRWPDIWMGVLVVAALAAASLGVFGFTRDHKIRYYYLSRQYGQTCVEADIDWGLDQTTFCSDSSDRAMEALKKLMEALPK